MILRFTVTLAGSKSAEEIRRKTAEVFARPDYDPNYKSWQMRLAEAIGQFFTWLGTLSTQNPWLFWVMLIGCISLLLLILAHLVWTVYRAATMRGKHGVDASALKQARLKQSAEYFAAAQAAASVGDFTEAIRRLFLALVFRYDEAGRVMLKRSVTNREYLNLLDKRLPVRPQLTEFVDVLDDYWYAQRPAAAERYNHFLKLYERLAAA